MCGCPCSDLRLTISAWPFAFGLQLHRCTGSTSPVGRSLRPGTSDASTFLQKKTQRCPFQTDEGFVDIFHMFWAQLAGLAIGTLRVTPKARPQ
jgi:hypothetical protein